MIEKKNEKERVLNVNVNAITTKSFFYDKENTIQDPINYSKFEIKKKFEPVYRNTAYEKENSSMPKTSSSFRPAITPNEMRREKV